MEFNYLVFYSNEIMKKIRYLIIRKMNWYWLKFYQTHKPSSVLYEKSSFANNCSQFKKNSLKFQEWFVNLFSTRLIHFFIPQHYDPFEFIFFHWLSRQKLFHLYNLKLRNQLNPPKKNFLTWLFVNEFRDDEKTFERNRTGISCGIVPRERKSFK